MIRFRDFLPRPIEKPGYSFEGEFDSLASAIRAADAWIENNGIDVINIETVVLPNLWTPKEKGTDSASLGAQSPTFWHQFIRCWYRTEE